MGEKAIENRVKKLKGIEEQMKALQLEATKLKEEIKKEMEARELEELKVGNFLVRWKSIATNKFDTKAFSKEYSYLYEQFIKKSESKRFTVA